MNKGMFYKGILILAIIVFAVLLILPTVGVKTLEINLYEDAVLEDIKEIEKRFSSDKFEVVKKGSVIDVKAAGLNITDAVMNELKNYKGVKDAKILPHWTEKALLAKKISYGLDLQGGAQIVLMADFDKIKERYLTEKKTLTEEKGILENKILSSSKQDEKDAIKKQLDQINYDLKDLNENKLTENSDLRDKLKSDITYQALEMLRNRVDKFGVSEPSILLKSNDAIEIQLPGLKDPTAVKALIGTTGAVQYILVDDEYTLKAVNWLAANNKDKILPEDMKGQKAFLEMAAKEIKLPDNLKLLFEFNRDPKTNKLYPAEIMALQKTVSLAGDDISKAWVGNDEYGAYIVQFHTTTDGAMKFAKVTGENIGKRLAIIIDDKIRSAPNINSQIGGGSAQITGNFTADEVKALANIIQEGALPVNLIFAQETTVGPSLGQDAIETGVKALLIGLAGLMIFVIIYYKIAGLIAVFGIGLNAVVILAILSWLGFTLTLPGIAGYILTIGLSIDANVLIYERIKEEFREGKPVKVAVTNGFDKAFSAIFDGNITTLIMAFVLTQYGTGPIKGFAVTLTVGVVSTMFIALVVTKYIFSLISLTKIKKISI